MRYHLSLILTVSLTFALAMPLLAGQPAAPRLEQNSSQSQVDQLRADYARLKIEMNQTLVQLRRFKQQLAASKQPTATPDAAAPMYYGRISLALFTALQAAPSASQSL